SPACCTLSAVSSTPMDGATPCIAARNPIPVGLVGSRSTPAGLTRGSICLSNSSHFALMPYSDGMKPVMLPEGRERLVTIPTPTRSVTFTNTTGIVWVTCWRAMTRGLTSSSHDVIRQGSDQFFRLRLRLSADRCRTYIDADIAVLSPIEPLQLLSERGHPCLE